MNISTPGRAILILIACLVLCTASARGSDTAASDDNAKQDEEKKWDVNNPPGEAYAVDIDADEGTWMSLDVSPAGDEIVFDFLGDIYTIPVAGGSAKALTDEIAWNIQPRYSPDGRLIAFISDRAGGDNIWVMNRDGTGLRQVTEEDYRLVHCPVWTPDSQYIAARKHFTSRRSLGAGEVWLYHVSGGEGVQMIERPNDQKDLNEPAFSPDGRYLYFCQDTTAGNVFEYNKDSNKEIYVVKRLDRVTGEVQRYITGPGGAVRPTPSPDGKYLAFVRRVRHKSTLFLHEIASGAEWPIYDGLDRDMQETWAIHGVYPSMAWTPDSGSIVFWAGGKINRIDIKTKQAVVIDFSVETQRMVTKAQRFAVDVAPDRFKVKTLRWVRVSPDGTKVAFQTLGHIYIRNLPDGRAERLTTQGEHFEFYPSWSRDGNWIVYTTWNDEKLGEVRTASVDSGNSRVLTPTAGHYVEPVFSPDGKKVVYRRVSNDRLRTKTWTHDTGVYQVDTRGGLPKLITKKGTAPCFGSENDRVYLMDFQSGSKDDDDRRALISIDLDGSDRRTHFVSKNAVEYAISGDGKWLAFVERFNAYIVPFVRSGKSVEIGPKTKAIPVRQVSRDAGLYLHFSGDGRALHWSLGPELFSRDLVDAFDFLQGAPEKLPEPPASGIDIGFEVASDKPTGKIALVGPRIITMNGDEVIDSGTIVIERNRIKAIGPADRVKIPSDAFVIDCSGKTVMPGIIDNHSHGPYGGQGIIPQRNWGTYADLAFGITTNHDPSNHTETIFAASEMARAGVITAPRTFSTGTILYGASGSFKAEVDSLEDALSHLRRMKAVGAFTVKSYNQPRRDQRQQIMEAARQLNMMVVLEGGSLFHANMNMIIDGHTGIEHTIPVAKAYSDVIDLWSASGTGVTPTLVVAYGGVSGEYYWYQHTNVWENERLLTFVPRTIVDPRSRRRQMLPEAEYNHIDLARICKQLVDAGGHVQLGGHGQMAGLDCHWELWMFAQGGMTPLQCIRAATFDAARYIGLDGDIGSLEEGKLADLIVLDESPLENIRNSQTVRYTVINGRIYDARTMDQIGNHPQKRQKFYWEIDYRLEK